MTNNGDITKALAALHVDARAGFQHQRRLSRSPFTTSRVRDELRKGSPSSVEGPTTLHSDYYPYNTLGISDKQSRGAQTHLVEASMITVEEYQLNDKRIEIPPIAEIVGQNDDHYHANLDQVDKKGARGGYIIPQQSEIHHISK